MTDHCCAMWPKIRPLLGWFMTEDEPRTRLMPVIGEPIAGAPRVNHCPSCGAYVRSVEWPIEEQS